MQRSRVTFFTAGALSALVLCSGTAVAATGGKLILGHHNHESRTSTVSNRHGTALSLRSKPGTPSLRVSSRTTVPKLSADRLDGLSSGSFARANAGMTTVSAPGVALDWTGGAGVKDTIFAVATCPAGTLLTGGGYEDGTDTGRVVVDEASVSTANAWVLLVRIDPSNTDDQQAPASAMAKCLSLTGPVRADKTVARTPASALRDVLTPSLRRSLARTVR
jgi:hypothetical protein